jgi:NAD(P)-dependent dehydrogenase (short-subunit alcohol dehydrogenase family)
MSPPGSRPAPPPPQGATISAVITGASQGIGEAIAIAFAQEKGARLYLVARNAEALQDVAARCTALGAYAEALPCDLTDAVAVARVATALASAAAPPNVLINNAGRFKQQELFSTTVEQFRDSLDTNLVSAFLMTQALAPAMMKRGKGTIIFMGSVASKRGFADSAAYTAAKHGLLGLARSVRLATRDAGLRVSTIMPGATNSPSWETSAIPKGRLMPAEDIAQSVLSIVKLSERTVVEEIVLRPIAGDF